MELIIAIVLGLLLLFQKGMKNLDKAAAESETRRIENHMDEDYEDFVKKYGVTQEELRENKEYKFTEREEVEAILKVEKEFNVVPGENFVRAVMLAQRGKIPMEYIENGLGAKSVLENEMYKWYNNELVSHGVAEEMRYLPDTLQDYEKAYEKDQRGTYTWWSARKQVRYPHNSAYLSDHREKFWYVDEESYMRLRKGSSAGGICRSNLGAWNYLVRVNETLNRYGFRSLFDIDKKEKPVTVTLTESPHPPAHYIGSKELVHYIAKAKGTDGAEYDVRWHSHYGQNKWYEEEVPRYDWDNPDEIYCPEKDGYSINLKYRVWFKKGDVVCALSD